MILIFNTLLYCSLLVSVRSQTVEVGAFLNPPSINGNPTSVYTDDLAWALDSVQHVQWHSSCVSVQLFLYQQGNANQSYEIFGTTAPDPGNYTWTVAYPGHWSMTTGNPGNVFYFQIDCLVYGGSSGLPAGNFSSHYFNISNATTSTSSSSSLIVASTGTTLSSSSITLVPSAAASTHPAETLSTGAKAGIGVGASLGGLALAGVGVYLYLRNRRGKGTIQDTVETTRYQSDTVKGAEVSYPPTEAPYHTPPRQELGDNSVSELEGYG